MLKLEYNANLGRVIRMDDIDTIGRSTYAMLEDAIAADRTQEALALSEYYLRELRIMHDILMTWAQDIIRCMIVRDAAAGSGRAGASVVGIQDPPRCAGGMDQ